MMCLEKIKYKGMRYYSYRRPRTSIEERQRRELFQSEGFQKWLEEMLEIKKVGEVVSNCCCEKLIKNSERCSKCNENCTPINI